MSGQEVQPSLIGREDEKSTRTQHTREMKREFEKISTPITVGLVLMKVQLRSQGIDILSP